MPSKTKLKNAAIAERSAALPKIPQELLDQFVQGPMTAESIQDVTMALKKALIERALGGELSHHLGYLPGGDKTRITRAETTLAALAVAAAELAPGGLLTIAVYPGHEGGREEQRTVAAWAESLPARAFEVQLLRPINRAAAPPECWAVLKKG